MSFGFGFGFPKNYVAATLAPFTPAALFTGSTTGVWYDPSDLTTLFQDAAGTTPVTAVEQPVGLMLDKSKNGVGTNGAKRVNLLTKTEDISASDWAVYSIASRTTTKFIPSTGGGEHYIVNSTSKTATAIQYSARFDVKDEGYGFAPIVVGDWSGFSASNGWYFCVNLSDGSYTTPATFGSGWSVGTVAITRDSTTGICTVSLVFTTSAVSTRVGIGIYAYPSLKATSPFSFVGDGTSGIYCSKIDLRLASEAATLPTYQKITDTWYSTLPGNHAFNSSGNSANFPVLSARYNLLTKTEQFDDAAWTKTGGISVATYTTSPAPDGTTTADQVTCVSGANAVYVQSTDAVVTSAGSHTLMCSVLKGKSFNLTIDDASANGVGVFFNGSTGAGTTVLLGSGWTVTASSCVTHPSNSNYWLASATISGPSAIRKNIAIRPNVNNSATYAGDCTAGQTIVLWGADLRVANDALNQPAYQRVDTATDYDTVGFKPYLKFNGTNQWLQTNSIDFTYGDKMFVCAGVRKLSDATTQMLFETSTASTSYNGAFCLTNKVISTNDYWFNSRGTIDRGASSNIAVAPITNVISGIGDISGDQSIIRINGTQAATNTGDQGTGNYGNYPLYIGARGGSSLWFNGRLYQLVVAGKQASAAELLQTEDFMELKTFNKDMSWVYDGMLTDAAGNPITDTAGNQIYTSVIYQ